jgi:hypothetical protein
MNRRLLAGVLAGVAAATVVLAVGIGSYRAGQEDEVVARTVPDGEVVRVVDDRDRDFFPGFILVPLLVVGLVVLATRGRRGPGWARPYGPGGPGGPYGYGRPGFGPGPWGPAGCDPDAALHEWHRRAHEGDTATATAVADAPPATGTGTEADPPPVP